MTQEELRSHIETIEKAYEFFLAYAAQGVRDDGQSKVGGQLRDFLEGMAASLAAIPSGVQSLIDAGEVTPADEAQPFQQVIEHDAGQALAAVRLVQAQPSIGSQLIDNLNASIHVRALLTDLFLIDEVLDKGRTE